MSISTKVEFKGKLLIIHRKGLTPLTCKHPFGNPAAAPEKIDFSNTTEIEIEYTPVRRTAFGDYPSFTLWLNENGLYTQSFIYTLQVTPAPPNQTTYTMTLNGPSTGFILLSTT